MADVNVGRLYVTLEGRDVGLSQMLANAKAGMGNVGQSSLNATSYVDAFKNGLVGMIGPAAAVGTTLAIVKGTVDSFREAFTFKAELDQQNASIATQLKGIRDLGVVTRQAAEYADKYKLTQKEVTDATQAAIPIIRNSTASMEQILGVFERLAIKQPGKTISDAARAIGELQAGQVGSVEKIFNVLPDDANRMKQEILKGADAVQVLDKYLASVGIGMDALANKATGVNGKLRELAQAQERLKLAQADFAQGPGMVILEGQIRTLTGLTRVLSGDFGAMGQSIRNTGTEFAASAMGAAAYATALASGKSAVEAQAAADQAATAATQAFTAAQQGGGSGTWDLVDAVKANVAVLSDETAKKLEGEVAAAALAAEQAQLAADSNLAAQGLLGAGNQAELLASKYHLAAGEAEFLIQQQQRLMNGAALADQRAGERSPGGSGTAEATAEEDRRLQAIYRGLEDPPKKAREAHGVRLSDQQKFDNKMLDTQTQYDDQSEAKERDHQNKLLDIAQQGAEKQAEQARRNEVGKRASRADFYDSLYGQDFDTSKFAAQYEQAYAKSQQIAQQGNRKLSEDYLAMKQRQIQADEEYAKQAKEVTSSDLSKGEKAQRLANIEERRKLREQANAEEEKQLLESGDQLNNEQAKQLADENKRYQDATDAAAQKFDDLAARRVAAYQRANGVIAGVPPAELTQANATSTGAPTPTPTAPKASEVLAVQDSGVVNAIQSQTSSLKDALADIKRAVSSVEHAVNGIHLSAPGAVQ